MTQLALIEDAYKVVSKIYMENQNILCQPLPGSSRYGQCPDNCELYFPEFGLHYDNLKNNFNEQHISKGICYKIKEFSSNETIDSLTITELKKYYRTICSYCEHEYKVNDLKNNDRQTYDSFIYMDIDRPDGTIDYCHGLTDRLQFCKNYPMIGKNVCSSHRNQKISGINLD